MPKRGGKGGKKPSKTIQATPSKPKQHVVFPETDLNAFRRLMGYRERFSLKMDLPLILQLKKCVSSIPNEHHAVLIVLAIKCHSSEAVHVLTRENRFDPERVSLLSLITMMRGMFLYSFGKKSEDDTAKAITKKILAAIKVKLASMDNKPNMFLKIFDHAEFDPEIIRHEWVMNLLIGFCNRHYITLRAFCFFEKLIDLSENRDFVALDWFCHEKLGARHKALRPVSDFLEIITSTRNFEKLDFQSTLEMLATHFLPCLAAPDQLPEAALPYFLVTLILQGSEDALLEVIQQHESSLLDLLKTLLGDQIIFKIAAISGCHLLSVVLMKSLNRAACALMRLMLDNNISLFNEDTITQSTGMYEAILSEKPVDLRLLRTCLGNIPGAYCTVSMLRKMIRACFSGEGDARQVNEILLLEVLKKSALLLQRPWFNSYARHGFSHQDLKVIATLLQGEANELFKIDQDSDLGNAYLKMAINALECSVLEYLKEDPTRDLSDEEMMKLNNTSLFDICLALSRTEVRDGWVIRKLYALLKTSQTNLHAELTKIHSHAFVENEPIDISAVGVLSRFGFNGLFALVLLLDREIDFSNSGKHAIGELPLKRFCERGDYRMADAFVAYQAQQKTSSDRASLGVLSVDAICTAGSPMYYLGTQKQVFNIDDLVASISLVDEQILAGCNNIAKLQLIAFIFWMKFQNKFVQGTAQLSQKKLRLLDTQVMIIAKSMTELLLKVAYDSGDAGLIYAAIRLLLDGNETVALARDTCIGTLCFCPDPALFSYMELTIDELVTLRVFPGKGLFVPTDMLSILMLQLECQIIYKNFFLASYFLTIIVKVLEKCHLSSSESYILLNLVEDFIMAFRKHDGISDLCDLARMAILKCTNHLVIAIMRLDKHQLFSLADACGRNTTRHGQSNPELDLLIHHQKEEKQFKKMQDNFDRIYESKRKALLGQSVLKPDNISAIFASCQCLPFAKRAHLICLLLARIQSYPEAFKQSTAEGSLFKIAVKYSLADVAEAVWKIEELPPVELNLLMGLCRGAFPEGLVKAYCQFLIKHLAVAEIPVTATQGNSPLFEFFNYTGKQYAKACVERFLKRETENITICSSLVAMQLFCLAQFFLHTEAVELTEKDSQKLSELSAALEGLVKEEPAKFMIILLENIPSEYLLVLIKHTTFVSTYLKPEHVMLFLAMAVDLQDQALFEAVIVKSDTWHLRPSMKAELVLPGSEISLSLWDRITKHCFENSALSQLHDIFLLLFLSVASDTDGVHIVSYFQEKYQGDNLALLQLFDELPKDQLIALKAWFEPADVIGSVFIKIYEHKKSSKLQKSYLAVLAERDQNKLRKIEKNISETNEVLSELPMITDLKAVKRVFKQLKKYRALLEADLNLITSESFCNFSESFDQCRQRVKECLESIPKALELLENKKIKYLAIESNAAMNQVFQDRLDLLDMQRIREAVAELRSSMSETFELFVTAHEHRKELDLEGKNTTKMLIDNGRKEMEAVFANAFPNNKPIKTFEEYEQELQASLEAKAKDHEKHSASFHKPASADAAVVAVAPRVNLVADNDKLLVQFTEEKGMSIEMDPGNCLYVQDARIEAGQAIMHYSCTGQLQWTIFQDGEEYMGCQVIPKTAGTLSLKHGDKRLLQTFVGDSYESRMQQKRLAAM